MMPLKQTIMRALEITEEIFNEAFEIMDVVLEHGENIQMAFANDLLPTNKYACYYKKDNTHYLFNATLKDAAILVGEI